MCKAKCTCSECVCGGANVSDSVCVGVCGSNPTAQVALLKGAKWRLWLGFDKWPLTTKATFANFGDEVEGEVTRVKGLCLCVAL